MNEKENFSTDFLFTNSSFLTGCSTVFNLRGNFYEYNGSESSEEADSKALRNDFQIVGQDLLKSINQVVK